MKPRIATAALAAVLVAVAVSQQVSRAAAAAALGPEPLPQHLTETGLYASDPADTEDTRPGSDPGYPGSEPGRSVTHLVAGRGVRQFLPQYPLWSDGMTKRRWIFLPKGTSINAASELAWQFPVGTKFWKEFSLNGRRIETRFSWKASATQWVMASYVWNQDGTDAVLAPAEGVDGVAEVAPGRRHSIPSRSDCSACHGTTSMGPLGFNALQLSNDRDPNAIHGDALSEGTLTLGDLITENLLSPAPTHFIANPPRIRTSNPATRSVLGYLTANCMMCHSGGSDGTPLGPALSMGDLLQDADAAARNLVGRPSSWQVPTAADGHSVVVHPGSPDLSALFVRLRSRAPSSQMPPLGTVIRDQQAVDAIERWISSMR